MPDATRTRPRVLVVGLNYPPEATGIAPYTGGMAAGLARDFDVEVVTAHPHYPEWRRAEGYAGWRRTEHHDAVRVHRLAHFVPSDPSGPSRILSELSFAGRAAAPGVRRPDAVVAVTPALLSAASAVALGRRWGVPVGVVVQDVYSKAFAELGLLGGRLDPALARLERGILTRATAVATIHERMADVLSRDLGVEPARVRVVRNWSHVAAPVADRAETRRSLGWDDDTLTVVHAGNIGAKQGLDHLVPIGRSIDEQGLPVRVVVVGAGPARDALEAKARGTRSIVFHDPVPADGFTDFLAAADALLLHEAPGIKDMCVPSKLTSYFAAGRPVLAVTDADSAAAHEVRTSGAGVVAAPGDPHAFLDAVERLRRADREQMGAGGREYAVRVLDEQSALDGYRDWVGSLLGSSKR